MRPSFPSFPLGWLCAGSRAGCFCASPADGLVVTRVSFESCLTAQWWCLACPSFPCEPDGVVVLARVPVFFVRDGVVVVARIRRFRTRPLVYAPFLESEWLCPSGVDTLV